MKTKLIAAVLLNLSTFQVMAQDTEMDPVTLTASLTPEKASRTGRNLFVIRGERFNRLPVHSIDELLRYLPGIEVQARGPMGAQSDIVLRGGTFQQVLVILDGVRLNDPNTGHFTSYIPIVPSEIERIEVLKGASSALYGTEAVGGVVHIITKTFAAKRTDPKKYNVGVQIGGGGYQLFNVQAGISATSNRTTVNTGILLNNALGQQQRGTHGYFNNHTASLSIGHHFNDKWHASIRTAYDSREFAAQNFYTTFVSDTALEEVQTAWAQAQVSRATEANTFRVSAGYKMLEDDYRFNSISAPNNNKSYLAQALITDEIKWNEDLNLTIGTQYIGKKIRSNDRGNHNLGQAALFALVNYSPGKLAISPALRIDYHERAGWELVPQLNLSYRTGPWQLRASGGKTIRDADFTERFNNYNKLLVTSGRIGNPDLEAERSISYEAGGDYFSGTRLRISGTFFQRFQERLIDYVPTAYGEMPRKENLSPTGTYALARNISEVNTTGAELDLQYVHSFSEKSQLWSTLGMVWLNSKSSEAVPSFYISSHARFLTNFNVQYTQGRWSFGVNGLYKSRQPQATSNPTIAPVSSDYFLLNAKVEARLWQNRLAAFLQVDNLFNRNYTDLLGAQMPGRWFMGGIKISLSK
jgi:vitamin B12 transporter